MSFADAVKTIPSINNCLKDGLKALGNYSKKISPENPRSCNGSIDIDTCLQTLYPNDARWDYVVGYEGKAYFIEVHPASGQVSAVIAKATWLSGWLKTAGAPLATIHADGNFHWIPTNGVNIIGKDKRRLAQHKIVVANQFKLP